MKRIGRMLALLVSMLLLVGLTACTPRSVVGSWRCTVDLSRAAQAAGALDGLDEQSGVGGLGAVGLLLALLKKRKKKETAVKKA